jgi:UDP-N-acetylglucosamine 2-epimerase (non-hydrolysing)
MFKVRLTAILPAVFPASNLHIAFGSELTKGHYKKKMKKILFVFGTRPEAIKMAPLIMEFKKRCVFQTVVAVTGQHRQMLDQVLSLFQITPDFDLDVMQGGQDLFDLTSRILLGMRDILKEVKPDCVLVHGDTSSSYVTALAAYYSQLEVGHVEAGLRTHNIYSPWPEEINRQLTARIARFHFAPTSSSRQNLLSEGISESAVYVTGNTVIDALQHIVGRINASKEMHRHLDSLLESLGIPINAYPERRMILITGHRRENFGQGFLQICNAIRHLAIKYPEVDFIYPVHLNPNVQNPVRQILARRDTPNVCLIEPLDYLPFVYLMSKSYFLLTDSGGIQEEAPGLGKPVLVMRDTTERPEAVEAGTVKLVGAKEEAIITAVSELLQSRAEYEKMARSINPYGDGSASIRITDILQKRYLASVTNA